MRAYAQGTGVAVEKTRAEIDSLLTRNGATSTAILNDTEKGIAAIGFSIKGARYRLELPLPTAEDVRKAQRTRRGVDAAQLCRERWRAVFLLLKSKLEIVRIGLTSIEKEFMADMILPNGAAVHEVLAEELRHGFGTGPAPKQLEGGTS